MMLTTLFHRSRGEQAIHRAPASAQAGLAALAAACILAACGGGGPTGAPGTAALVKSSAEPAGANCAAGGTRVQSGLDLDSNGSLEASEVTGTNFICNGAVGAAGAGGAPGAAAIANLVRTTPEPAGANCASGGIRIQSGADTSGNGALEPLEVTQTSYACNGATGTAGAAGSAGFSSLIKTSPEAAGANCPAGGVKVESGLDTSRDGALQSAEVTSTSYICRAPSTAAKSWGTSVAIEAGAGDTATPHIAINASGQAVAVWVQSDGASKNTYANLYTPGAGGGWGTAVLIEASAGRASSPKVAIDADGNAVAVWAQFDGAQINIYANRYTAGAARSWGTATLLDDATGEAGVPQIAIDASGNATAVWRQFDGAFESIYSARYVPGPGGAAAGWPPAQKISDGTNDADNPQIAMDASGNSIAVWQQYNGTRDRIYANRFANRAAGGWGTAVAIELLGAASGNHANPKISVNASGNAAVVWRETLAGNQYVNGTFYKAGVGWAGSNNGIAFITIGTPEVAMDANDEATVIFSKFEGGFVNIYATRLSGLGTRGSDNELIEAGTLDTINPRVAVDPSGNAVVVWQQSDGTRFNIWANRYSPGNGWGRPTLIETDNTDNAINPEIAIDASGNAVAVHLQSDGAKYNVVSNDLR